MISPASWVRQLQIRLQHSDTREKSFLIIVFMISSVDNYKSWNFSSLSLVIRGFHVIKKSTLTRHAKKNMLKQIFIEKRVCIFPAYEKVSPGNLWDEILNCLMFNFSLHFCFLFHWTPSYSAAMKERKVSFQEEKQREKREKAKSSSQHSTTFTIINGRRSLFSVYLENVNIKSHDLSESKEKEIL